MILDKSSRAFLGYFVGRLAVPQAPVRRVPRAVTVRATTCCAVRRCWRAAGRSAGCSATCWRASITGPRQRAGHGRKRTTRPRADNPGHFRRFAIGSCCGRGWPGDVLSQLEKNTGDQDLPGARPDRAAGCPQPLGVVTDQCRPRAGRPIPRPVVVLRRTRRADIGAAPGHLS